MLLVTRLVTVPFKWVHFITCKCTVMPILVLLKRLRIRDFLESREFHDKETVGIERGKERCSFLSEVIRDFK